MKHAVVVAHPNRRSFTGAVARAYVEAVRELGHHTTLRDLYALDFDPRLPASELPWAEPFALGEDVSRERRALADADVFVLIYPFWFNAPPAILKGYIDRVFGMGFGFEPGGLSNRPALDGRRLLSFTSSGAPDHWVMQTEALSLLRRSFDDHLAGVCGLRVLDHVHHGEILPGIRSDAVWSILAHVRQVARDLFGPA